MAEPAGPAPGAPAEPPAPSGAAAMADPEGRVYLLQAGPRRYLCHCRPGGTVHVTDALEVWAGELGSRSPLGCRCRPEEHGARLREALGRGAASLSLGEGKGTLRLPEDARCAALELVKLPVAEARSQLQALVFGMAERIESLERQAEVMETLASPCSPEKNTARSQQHFLPDPSSRKNRGAGSTLPARRKIPGESLINPGFKSKKAPSGVDFEDS